MRFIDLLSTNENKIFSGRIGKTIMGEDSPVKFTVNGSPIKLVVPPALVFFVTFALYRNSKKAIEENTK